MEATDAQLKEYIEGKRQEMLDLWAEIVNTESGPKQLDGVNRVGDILQRELEKTGPGAPGEGGPCRGPDRGGLESGV